MVDRTLLVLLVDTQGNCREEIRLLNSVATTNILDLL